MTQQDVFDYLKQAGDWVGKNELCNALGIGKSALYCNLRGLLSRKEIQSKRIGNRRLGFYRLVVVNG